jgi:hypothetical protein
MKNFIVKTKNSLLVAIRKETLLKKYTIRLRTIYSWWLVAQNTIVIAIINREEIYQRRNYYFDGINSDWKFIQNDTLDKVCFRPSLKQSNTIYYWITTTLKKIELQTTFVKLFLDIQATIPIGVNSEDELVNNAYKHAFL